MDGCFSSRSAGFVRSSTMNTSIGQSARRPASRIFLDSPIRRNISIDRALQRSIFGKNCGSGFRSRRIVLTPALPRLMARDRPTGPAPTTITLASKLGSSSESIG